MRPRRPEDTARQHRLGTRPGLDSSLARHDYLQVQVQNPVLLSSSGALNFFSTFNFCRVYKTNLINKSEL